MAQNLAELVKSVSDLDGRTRALETKYTIAIAIAVILGLGGAGIGGLLSNAYTQIGELRRQITAYKTEIDQAEAKAIGGIKAAGQNTINEINKTIASFKIYVGAPSSARTYESGEFWTAQQDTRVTYTCQGNSVLAGMNFTMHSDGVGRHPYQVEYICKTLGP